MKVLINGQVKDLHYTVAAKLLKEGKAKKLEEKKERKKVNE